MPRADRLNNAPGSSRRLGMKHVLQFGGNESLPPLSSHLPSPLLPRSYLSNLLSNNTIEVCCNKNWMIVFTEFLPILWSKFRLLRCKPIRAAGIMQSYVCVPYAMQRYIFTLEMLTYGYITNTLLMHIHFLLSQPLTKLARISS